jgi:hypothetical protein
MIRVGFLVIAFPHDPQDSYANFVIAHDLTHTISMVSDELRSFMPGYASLAGIQSGDYWIVRIRGR